MGIFVYIKTSSQKHIFVRNVNNNDSHQQKKKCTFLYIQQKKNIEKRLYIYKKPHTLQKARQFALRFIHKRPYTLRYMIFHEIFEIGIYIYTKSMTFCVS